MSLPDFLLEASRVLIAVGLAVFVGVPLARLLGRMTHQGENEGKRKIFLEGEKRGEEREGEKEGEADRFGRAKFVAAGALLVGVLLEVQVMGSALPPRNIARAIVLFVLVASLVYSVMVIAPKARYYDERSSAFEENLRAPWHARSDAARARGSRVDLFGLLLAFAALVLG
ncbi:MAG TPA: hypothetical protein VF425_07350 [Thermoanaerobaculia bacterium]